MREPFRDYDRGGHWLWLRVWVNSAKPVSADTNSGNRVCLCFSLGIWFRRWLCGPIFTDEVQRGAVRFWRERLECGPDKCEKSGRGGVLPLFARILRLVICPNTERIADDRSMDPGVQRHFRSLQQWAHNPLHQDRRHLVGFRAKRHVLGPRGQRRSIWGWNHGRRHRYEANPLAKLISPFARTPLLRRGTGAPATGWSISWTLFVI